MATTIDDALDILHRTGPDLVGGNSNHGPMVAEALCTLGRPDAVLPWLEGYKRRFQDRPQTRYPLSPDGWQEALGDHSRSADWVAFFDRALAEAPWPAVLQELDRDSNALPENYQGSVPANYKIPDVDAVLNKAMTAVARNEAEPTPSFLKTLTDEVQNVLNLPR